MKKKHILFSTIISMGMMVSSCSDYLSVEGKLGENTQSLENIFENKEWSEQWLATAYAWLTWSTLFTIRPARTASTSDEVEITTPQVASAVASVNVPPNTAEAKSTDAASAVATLASVVS